jgi:chaperonin GroEL
LYVWFQFISENLGLKLEKMQPNMFGSTKRVTISKDDTIILDGGGDKKAIEEQCEQVLIS